MNRKSTKLVAALVLIAIMAIGGMVVYSKQTSAADQITVYWKGNGGKNSSGATSHYTYYYNKSSVTLKPAATIYTRSGYTLTGFSVNGRTYSVGQSFTITKNTTVTCQWRPNYVTVSFNGGLGRQHNSITVAYGTTVEKAMSLGGIPAASEGYHRKYNENSLDGARLYDSTKITKNMTIVVNAEANTGLLVIENVDGEGTTRTYTAVSGKEIRSYLTVFPIKEGYFVYALKENSSGKYVTSEKGYSPILRFKNNGDTIKYTLYWAKKTDTTFVTYIFDRSTIDLAYYHIQNQNLLTQPLSGLINVLKKTLSSEAGTREISMLYSIIKDSDSQVSDKAAICTMYGYMKDHNLSTIKVTVKFYWTANGVKSQIQAWFEQ